MKRIITPTGTTVTKPKTAKEISKAIRQNQQLKSIKQPLKLSLEVEAAKALESLAENLRSGKKLDLEKELENILQQVREYV